MGCADVLTDELAAGRDRFDIFYDTPIFRRTSRVDPLTHSRFDLA
jgi:hypothetical protein